MLSIMQPRKVLLLNDSLMLEKSKPIDWHMHAACFSRCVRRVVKLINQGADPCFADVTGLTPVMIAAQKGSRALFKALVRHGAAIDAVDNKGWNIVHHASACGQTAFIRFIAVHSPDLLHGRDEDGRTAVHIATIYGKWETVSTLIKLNVDPNATDRFGRTAFLLAAEYGHFNVLECLRCHGADTSCRDYEGNAAIHEAARSGYTGILEYLVQKLGADINAANQKGQTPLHLSVLHRKIDTIQAILRLNGNVNAQNGNGDTPLNLACALASTSIARLLIDHGADPYISNRQNKNAIQLARESGIVLFDT